MDSQTNVTDNSEFQAQVQLVEIETTNPIVATIAGEPAAVVQASEVAATSPQKDAPSADPSTTRAGKVVSDLLTEESTESPTIPVGKIVLGLLALDAVWTLICSITPTIVVYQAAVLANTNPVLVLLATGTSFLTLFVSSFLFNLFFAFCFSFVFGGGAFVVIIAFFSIFGNKK